MGLIRVTGGKKMTLSENEIFNWVLVVISIAVAYYMLRKNNTVYIGVRDNKNKIHKIPVYTTDNEKQIMEKVKKYMEKNQ